MTSLKEALETSHRDLCLSHAIREENLCEWVLPRLEYFLIETLRCSKEFLVQMRTRLFHPWLQEMTNSLSELYELLRNVSQRLKQLIEHFRQNAIEPTVDYATLEKQIQDYVDARLMGEKPQNLWQWNSLNHLKICIRLLENQENTFQLMEHVQKELTEEVVNTLAEKAYTEFKANLEIVRRNYLKDLHDELGDDLPDKQFMGTKLKDLRADSGPNELMNLAQNYQGNWFQLIEAMKEKGYSEKHLLMVFMYYFKKEILFSLKNREIENMECPTLDAKEKIRKSIIQLQNEKIMVDHKGVKKEKYIFRCANHWIAVFRVLVDHGHFRPTDYKGFSQYMNQLDNGLLRIPCKYDALKNISKTVFFKPLNSWKYDSLYHNSREPYEQMLRLANRYLEIYQQTT